MGLLSQRRRMTHNQGISGPNVAGSAIHVQLQYFNDNTGQWIWFANVEANHKAIGVIVEQVGKIEPVRAIHNGKVLNFDMY